MLTSEGKYGGGGEFLNTEDILAGESPKNTYTKFHIDKIIFRYEKIGSKRVRRFGRNEKS